MSTAKWILRNFEFEDVQVLQPSDDVAIIGYKVHEDITVDGQPLTLERDHF